jgi:hypothetical protein
MSDTDLIRSDKLYEIIAEHHAVPLLEALKAAVAGAPHWRVDAQKLLRAINAFEIQEPPK